MKMNSTSVQHFQCLQYLQLGNHKLQRPNTLTTHTKTNSDSGCFMSIILTAQYLQGIPVSIVAVILKGLLSELNIMNSCTECS